MQHPEWNEIIKMDQLVFFLTVLDQFFSTDPSI